MREHRLKTQDEISEMKEKALQEVTFKLSEASGEDQQEEDGPATPGGSLV